jgi:hypothetical protein
VCSAAWSSWARIGASGTSRRIWPIPAQSRNKPTAPPSPFGARSSQAVLCQAALARRP